MSIDCYLGRRYNAATYNCAHLVCDVWRDIKGPEMAEVLRGFLCPPKDRKTFLKDLRRIRFLDRPIDPCVVLMQSPRQPPHVGVWIRGRVLHIQEKSSVQYQPLDVAAIYFKSVRFFTC